MHVLEVQHPPRPQQRACHDGCEGQGPSHPHRDPDDELPRRILIG